MTENSPDHPEDGIKKANDGGLARGIWSLVFVAATLGLLGMGYAYYRSEYDRVQREKYQDLAAIALIKGRNIEQWRRERWTDAQTVAKDVLLGRTLDAWLRNENDAKLRKALRNRLSTELKYGGYADVLLVSLDGRVLLSARPHPYPLDSVTKRAVKEAIAKDSPTLGALYLSSKGAALMDTVALVRGPTLRPLAALVFTSDLESVLYPLIQSWPTPSKTAETLLIRKDGDNVLFLNGLRHRSHAALTLREPFSRADLPAVQAVQGRTGMFLGRDYRNHEVLADLSRIHNSPWFMVAKVDSSEILKEARYRGKMIALFCVLVILLAGSATAYAYRGRQAGLFQELYQTEKKRREDQEEFRTTLYSIGDAVITTDTSGLIKQMNGVAEQLTGWMESDAKARSLEEVFNAVVEESYEPVETPVRRVLRDGKVVGLANHTLLISKDGVKRPIADSGAPIHDDDGHITGVVLVFRDQTKERKAQRELEESEERYRTVADHIHDWELWIAPDGRVEYCSPSCERVTGYRAEEFIQDPDLLNRIVHTRDHRVWEKHVSRSAQDREMCKIDYRIVTRDGKVAWMAHCCLSVYSSDGKLLGRRLSNRDITDRKNVELELERSEERLRMAQEAASAGTWEWDLRTDKNFWSDECWPLFGLDRNSCEPSYEAWIDSVHPDDRENASKAIEEAASKGAELYVEWRVSGSDSGERWLMARGRPIRDTAGQPLRLVGIVMDVSDRKRAEEDLADSERRFRLLYEEAPIPYQSLDEDGLLLQVNAAWLQLLGYGHDEVIGKSFSEFLSSGSQIRFADTFASFKQAGEVYGVEHKIVCRDGSVVDVSIDGRVSLQKDGKFRRTHCVLQDITHRKKAEEALRESEEKFRATFNTASVGIDLVDSEGRLLEVNSTLAQFLGYSPEELRRRSIFDVAHPEDVGLAKEAHEAMVERRAQERRFEMRYIRKDGSTLWADTALAAIRDANGQYKATVGVINDITIRKRLEEARVRLGAAVEQAAEVVEITDSQGTIVYVNPSFERTTGYSREEALGKNPRILNSGRHDQEFYKHMWETISGGNVWKGHFVNKKKNGALFEEDVSISPIKDNAGKIVNYVAVKRDVTTEVSLQRQLVHAQKMESIGTLAGGVAHDFNNILQVTLGYSEVVLTDERLPENFRPDIQRIYDSSKRGADLVKQLLTFSRKTEIKPQPLNLNHRIKETMKMLQRTIPKMIEVRFLPAPNLSRVNADPTQIDQIIMNLAVNARDAMPEGGKLTIETSDVMLDEEYVKTKIEATTGRHVLLAVTDTGSGMDSQTLTHIFEPFFTTKGFGEGTGLGLATVHGIVKQHGGHITCYSELGIGTTFRIYLPADVTDETPEQRRVQPTPLGGSETILLVDDEDHIRELGSRILERAGYKVIKACNGKEALEVYGAKADQIDLVILDVIMPEMGGKQCLKGLLSLDPSLKVIIASGYSASGIAKESLSSGAKGFVNKPFDIRQMMAAVREVLDSE